MATTDRELQLLQVLDQAAQSHGIDIVDVEVVGSKKAPTVRIRIDFSDETLPTITLDEVAAQSSWINEVLDAFDPFEGSYTLEVSSPGLARPLRRPHDFERFAGSVVSLTSKAAEGRKHFTGTLQGLVEGKVRLTNDEGNFDFAPDDIKSCKIKPQFD